MILKAFVNITNLLNRLKEEDGMEMLQTVIIIAIAVGIGGILFAIIGNSNDGLLGTFNRSLTQRMNEFFSK